MHCARSARASTRSTSCRPTDCARSTIPRRRRRPARSVLRSCRAARRPPTSATCGWIRFYGMTPGAKANATRRANAVKFIEFFGGKDTTGAYRFQKLLLTDLGLPFCTMPLSADADVKAFWDKWAGGGDDHRPAGVIRASRRTSSRPGSASGTKWRTPRGNRSSSTRRRRKPPPRRDGAEVERTRARVKAARWRMRMAASAGPCRV